MFKEHLELWNMIIWNFSELEEEVHIVTLRGREKYFVIPYSQYQWFESVDDG